MTESSQGEYYTQINDSQDNSNIYKYIPATEIDEEEQAILNEKDTSINYEEWIKTFSMFLLHLISVYGLFTCLLYIDKLNNSKGVELTLAVIISCTWLLGVIIIYWVKSLTKTSGSRWVVFSIFSLLTTFMALKILGTESYALLNLTIIMEPLLLCTIVGLASIKFKRRHRKYSSLCGAIFYTLLSGGLMYYGIQAMKEETSWVENYQQTIIYIHVGIVLGCLMFLLSLNSSAKWNSRFSEMENGEHVSCAIGIYMEIIICVSLALCIIFAQLAEED